MQGSTITHATAQIRAALAKAETCCKCGVSIYPTSLMAYHTDRHELMELRFAGELRELQRRLKRSRL